MIFALLIFWLSVLAMVHSYVLFPLLLSILARGKKNNSIIYTETDELPQVYLLMAVYNEEAVLREKIESIYTTTYPINKLHIHIGSDASTDGTNAILEEYKGRYAGFQPVMFPGRSGKIKINNTLYDSVRNEAQHGIVIMTDANVIFEHGTIFQLVKNFKNADIGLVGANIQSRKASRDGISYQEMNYVNRENLIKYHEGLVWGTMMGAFGACYALRGNLFQTVPENFRSDDFYLTLLILSKGKKAICELDAICYEDASNDVQEEYKRKVRISIGNFQNLKVHKRLLWPPFKALGFSFLSHKLLRWMGPYFIILAWVSNIWLIHLNKFYLFTFIMQSVFLLSPVFDAILKRLNIHTVLLRFVAYFYYMNLAMLVGLIKFLKGGIDNVWQPTKRNQ